MKKKSNGQGSISYEAERKLYRAAITDVNGKRIRKRFKTKAEAEEWLTLVKADIINGSYLPRTEYTLGEWMLEYMDTYLKLRIKESTFRKYQYDLVGIEPIADVNLQSLEPLMLQKFFVKEFAHRPAVGESVYKLLNPAMKKAEELGLLKSNPLKGVARPKRANDEKGIYTPEQINMILDAFSKLHVRRHYYDIILIAISTGMRLGEITALQKCCVFEDHIHIKQTATLVGGHIYINTPKTARSQRNVAISKSLYNRIMAIETKSDTDYIFATRHGTPYPNGDVSTIFKTIVKELGIPYYSFHALRHSHATWLLESGEFSVQQVSARLGHASPATTMRIYAHLLPGLDANAPTKIDEMLSVAPTLPPYNHPNCPHINKDDI